LHKFAVTERDAGLPVSLFGNLNKRFFAYSIPATRLTIYCINKKTETFFVEMRELTSPDFSH